MKGGDVLYPMQGVTIKKNLKNRFVVFELHYSADPQKRDPAYIQQIKSAMPIRQFNQEYELQWDSFEGLSVFADWDQTIHGVKGRIAPHVGLPLLCGVDFGLTPAFLVCQLQGETLCCIKEYTQTNMGAKRFFEWLTPQLRVDFPLWLDHARDYIVFIDPSGQFRKDTDEGTCAKVIDSFGFNKIVPGPVSWEERKDAVDYWLTRRTNSGPGFQVSLTDCPILSRGFQGGYRYNDSALEIEPNKLRPLKDVHSHIHDALQGVASRVRMSRPASNIKIPQVSYSWLGDNR